jgi:hypothetical protein
MMKKEKSEDKGQLPDFITAERGYFFELWRMGNIVVYETRWCPNTETLKQIADHFGISFTHQFSEPMTGILGQVNYSSDEQNGIYNFRNTWWPGIRHCGDR